MINLLNWSPLYIFLQIDRKGNFHHHKLIEGGDGLFCCEDDDDMEMVDLETLLAPFDDLGTRLYPTE